MDDELKWNNYSEERRLRRNNKGFILNLSGNNLNQHHMESICYTLLNRYYILNLNKLDLSINHGITDLNVKLLFKCIGEKCHKLENIDLSFANITDKSCEDIYRFYYKYFINKSNYVLLHKIDLSFTRITGHGLMLLDQLFDEFPSSKKKVKYIHNKKISKTATNNTNNKKTIKNKRSKHKISCNKTKRKKRKKTNKTSISEERRRKDDNDKNDILSLKDDHDHKDQSFDYIEMQENIDPFQKLIRSKHEKKSKSQSFEIVLKGCFFETTLINNYNCLASIPKLQTHCCIKFRFSLLIFIFFHEIKHQQQDIKYVTPNRADSAETDMD